MTKATFSAVLIVILHFSNDIFTSTSYSSLQSAMTELANNSALERKFAQEPDGQIQFLEYMNAFNDRRMNKSMFPYPDSKPNYKDSVRFWKRIDANWNSFESLLHPEILIPIIKIIKRREPLQACRYQVSFYECRVAFISVRKRYKQQQKIIQFHGMLDRPLTALLLTEKKHTASTH